MAKFHSLFQKIIHDTLLFFDSMEGKEKEKQKMSVDVVGMAVIGRVSNVFESDDGKKRRWVWTTYGSDCLEGFLFDGVGVCRERSATVRDEGRTC